MQDCPTVEVKPKTTRTRRIQANPKLNTGYAYDFIFKLGEMHGLLSQENVYNEIKQYLPEQSINDLIRLLNKIRGGFNVESK